MKSSNAEANLKALGRNIAITLFANLPTEKRQKLAAKTRIRQAAGGIVVLKPCEIKPDVLEQATPNNSEIREITEEVN